MDYPNMRAEVLPDHAKHATCNLLYAYIYAHIVILIDEYPVYGVQAILKLQY